MNNIKTQFSIKDLENLSGIKAHTIRIWEKRYKLLSPDRTITNIRFYNLENFQKLLNVTFLYNNGIKISKISALADEEIKAKGRNIISEKAVKNQFINDMKLAMMNFDQTLFENSYQKLLAVLEFKDIYVSYFIPFLQEIGLLWHTDTINPAHEHFITSLIKQKILVNTEKFQAIPPTRHDNRFVLFLPDNEIHELGLTYANFEILSRGYSSIYLGQSVPLECLNSFIGYREKVTFITYFTVAPTSNKIPAYLTEIQDKILSNCNGKLWIMGSKVSELADLKLNESIKLMTTPEMIDCL